MQSALEAYQRGDLMGAERACRRLLEQARRAFLGLQRLSQKGTQANAPAFLALTIQALIKLNCFASYLLRQPLQAEVKRRNSFLR
ncbi:MAG: hypothetical protein QOF74_3942 [Caballeronia mineralivorans]|jgi:hypothetical protein|nr:hypothetical protein [Caballeronia mineralivorans]